MVKSTKYRMSISRWVTVVVVALVAVGCGNGTMEEESRGTTVVTNATVSAGDAVQPPAQEALLTIRGSIQNANVDGELQFDLESLERLTVYAGEVFDPWAEADLAFQGVRLIDILALAGVGGAATSIELVALDDYVVKLPLEKLNDSVIVATRAGDGSPIPIDEGGHIRMVFLNDEDDVAHPNNWIWSLATVTVQ